MGKKIDFITEKETAIELTTLQNSGERLLFGWKRSRKTWRKIK